MTANGAGLRSRKSMLANLVRHLDMVRISIAASMLAMIGCTGLIDAPPPTKAELARQVWIEKAQPALKEATCTVCHAGQRPMVEFLAGADDSAVRESLLAFEPAVISMDAPQSSRLLNKGQHEGPPLVGQQKADVQEWIQAEKEAANDTGVGGPGVLTLRTSDFAFSVCTSGLPPDPNCPVNEISLDTLGEGAGIAGAKITFVAQVVGSGLYLNRLKLVPGPMGAFVEHPLFVSIPVDPMAKPIADTLDRFFNTKMNLMANATAEQQQIAGGTAAFVNFPPENKIAIFFKSAKIYQPDTGGGGGATGCKALPQFETSARAQLNANCSGCHANPANTNAMSAVDMTGIGAANAANACNQVRLRVNLTDINQSGIFLATTPGNANHDFTFGGNLTTFNAFKAALNPWIIAERDAP